MTHHLTTTIGRLAVLSTSTKAQAAAVEPTAGSVLPPPLASRIIEGVTILKAREGADGSWNDLQLRSIGGESEPAALAAISAELSELRDDDGLLVTFDGPGLEFPLLRMRSRANWAFDLDGLCAIPMIRQVALARQIANAGAISSVNEVCTGLGIPPQSFLQTTWRGPNLESTRSSQQEALGTFLILLHEIAACRRSVTPLANGWRALSNMLDTGFPEELHLNRFKAPAILSR